MVHAAVPAAASDTDAQPEIAVPESLKLTVPVGDAPATVAVSVTVDPAAAGFAELTNAVVVAPGACGVDPQLPLTLPAPLKRNVAVARQPGVMTIFCAKEPPSATGVIGCGHLNEMSLDELA